MKMLGFGAMMLLAALPAMTEAPATDSVALDNARIIVRDVRLTAGGPAQSLPRDHDVIVLFASGGRIRATGADGKSAVTTRHFGEAVFLPKGTVETDALVSGSPAREVVVELKDNPPPAFVNKSGLPDAYPREGARKILENDRIIVWNYNWTKKPTPMHYHARDAFLVFHYDGAIKSVTRDGQESIGPSKAGELRFSKADRVHYEVMASGRPSAVIVEFK